MHFYPSVYFFHSSLEHGISVSVYIAKPRPQENCKAEQ